MFRESGGVFKEVCIDSLSVVYWNYDNVEVFIECYKLLMLYYGFMVICNNIGVVYENGVIEFSNWYIKV